MGTTWAFRTFFSITWDCQPCRRVNEMPLFSQIPKPGVAAKLGVGGHIGRPHGG